MQKIDQQIQENDSLGSLEGIPNGQIVAGDVAGTIGEHSLSGEVLERLRLANAYFDQTPPKANTPQEITDFFKRLDLSLDER